LAKEAALLAPLAGRIYDHAPQQNAFPLDDHAQDLAEMDSRLPLIVIVAFLWLAWTAVIVLLFWLTAASSLPGLFKMVLGFFLLSFLISPIPATRRRFADGPNPWSKKHPERG
jgi:hypothetical protein